VKSIGLISVTIGNNAKNASKNIENHYNGNNNKKRKVEVRQKVHGQRMETMKQQTFPKKTNSTLRRTQTNNE
jgi:hypothetical protein